MLEKDKMAHLISPEVRSLDAAGTIQVQASLQDGLLAMTRGIVIVLNDDHTVAGIMTHGDIVKALKQGADINAPIKNHMNHSPLTMNYDTPKVLDGSVWSDATIRNRINLPLINESGQYVTTINYFDHVTKTGVSVKPTTIPEKYENLSFLFISGQPKSGTTWVKNILAAHPEVAMTPKEGHLITNCYSELKEFQRRFNSYPVSSFSITDDMIDESLRYISSRLLKEMGNTATRVFGEKTPQTGIHLPRLSRIFPDAKIIHIIRDGRDVVVSHWFNEFRNLKKKHTSLDINTKKTIPNRFVEGSIKYWLSGNLAFMRGVNLFAKKQILILRYEDLHANTAEWTQKILEFLEVENNAELIELCVENGSFEKQTNGRLQGVEDISHFFRKGIVGDYVNYLNEEQRAIIDGIASGLLRKFSYLDGE